MKKLHQLFVFFFLFVFSKSLYADINVVYLDIDFILQNSKAGKYLVNEIENRHKQNLDTFEKTESELKEKEKKILSQKNILKKEELQMKIKDLRSEVEEYKNKRAELVDSLNDVRINSSNKLLEQINPILLEYSKVNSISIILQKKNIIMGKSELDITQNILKLLDNKIEKIEIN